MVMTNRQVVDTLGRLLRIVEAGEKGFAVAAANVSNRGLKVVFKTCAQERAEFKSEILGEIRRLGDGFKPRTSIRGLIHRGRISIVAALNIGAENRENGVLKEVVLGERAAVRTYEKTLEKELPPETREIVERQFERVRQVNEQVNLLRGKDGMRLVVRLLDTEKDADTAIQALSEAGFPQERIERTTLSEATELYQGQGTTVLETVVSGAFGGALWGSLFGAVAGIGVAQTPGIDPIPATSIPGTWALIALSGLLIGAFIGAALGLFIGVGVSEEDTLLYDQSLEHGQIILKILVNEARASEARQIMSRVNLEAKAQVGQASA